MTMAARLRGHAVWLLIAASLCMAVGLSALPSSVATAASVPEATGATLATTPAPDPGAAFLGSDPRECVSQDATLATVPELSIAGSDVVARRTIANAALPCSRMVVLARWAAITDQRRDVLDLRRGEVLRILRGEAHDWSEFGGSAQPISVYLPASQAGAIAAGLGIPLSELAADLLPDDEVSGPRRSYAGRVRADRARVVAARRAGAHGQRLRPVPRPGSDVATASAGLGARAHGRRRHRAARGGQHQGGAHRSTPRECWSPAS